MRESLIGGPWGLHLRGAQHHFSRRGGAGYRPSAWRGIGVVLAEAAGKRGKAIERRHISEMGGVQLESGRRRICSNH